MIIGDFSIYIDDPLITKCGRFYFLKTVTKVYYSVCTDYMNFLSFTWQYLQPNRLEYGLNISKSDL